TLCSPVYCSAPQTWQTVAQRLMRDRHRRHILIRTSPPWNEDASAVKTRIVTFGSIASRLFRASRTPHLRSFALNRVGNRKLTSPARAEVITRGRVMLGPRFLFPIVKFTTDSN